MRLLPMMLISNMNWLRRALVGLVCLMLQPAIAFAASPDFWNVENGPTPVTSATNSEPAYFATKAIGSITYNIESLEVIERVPAHRAAPKYRKYAKDKSAKPGNVWIVARGAVQNLSHDIRHFNATQVKLIDKNGESMRPDFSMVQYIPDNMRPKAHKLQPGHSARWMVFYQVAKEATGLRLVLSNLHRTERAYTYLAIGSSDFPLSSASGVAAHHLFATQRLEVIPAEWTIEEHKKRARTRPAKDGFVWIVLDGQSTNTSLDTRQIDSRQLMLTDASIGKDYSPVTHLRRYQTPESMIKRGMLKPGETRHWRLFYQVPADATDFKLKAGNFYRIEQASETIELPDPATVLTVQTQ